MNKINVFQILLSLLLLLLLLQLAINRGIHKRHLAIQRSLQTQVEQRTEELQNTNNQLLAANEHTAKASRQDAK